MKRQAYPHLSSSGEATSTPQTDGPQTDVAKHSAFHGFPTGTITLLFTDIEGSTRLLRLLGDRYADALAACRRLLRAAFRQWHGCEVDTQGDAFFVVFARALDAVEAAVAAQHALNDHAFPAGVPVRIRIGLHTGEPQLASEGYVGLDVHHAARIMGIGYGGQILLSQTTRELVEHALPDGVSLRDLGEHQLKDLPRPTHLSQLVVAGLPADFPPLQTEEIHSQRDPLLTTKLHRPRLRTHFVPRLHLIEQLQQGTEQALTLLSAPAGFGKTTLLAHWLAEHSLSAAWLSLEAEDNDPTRFLFYMIAALQTLDARIGMTALAMLSTPQPPPPETVLAVLMNDLADRGEDDIILVLDDYHVITSDSIQRGMAFLLEHLPPHMHLVLATRSDPPLPLARLRARGQLREVRAADLRFGNTETGTFLRAVMGLDLEDSAIATLESHTEGWIAGLQLAALSLQGRADVSAFLAAFSGSHRYILDYLSDEVLARQPIAVQQFLLHTSILERLSGPLCHAVTGQEESQARLEVLERANLFVVALDDERCWYRYHHLFAQALRTHLQQAAPDLVPELHRRASVWYEQHDFAAEAAQHALAVPNLERAARLIEPIALSTACQGHIYTVLGWLNALPEALIYARPRLCVYYAQLLTLTNQLEKAEALLQQAEQHIQEKMPAEQARIIQGYLLDIRADIVLFSGDIPQAVSLAHQTLALLPQTEVFPYAGALSTTIRAYLVSGDVTPASERAVAAAEEFMRASDNRFSSVSSTCLLARLHTLQGRLRQAAATYEQVVQLVPRVEALQAAFSSLFYYFGLGDLLREWNNLNAAEQHLARGMALIKEARVVEPFVAALGYTALARLEQARGNIPAALEALEALAQVAERRHFAAHLGPQVAAARAQLELARGNLAVAIRWADTSGPSPRDQDVPYPREGEYLALARVRIAQARTVQALPLLQEVLHLLDRLQASAETNARMSSVLEILLLRALALEAQGNRTAALSVLEQALDLAEPEGYIRLFVDEGTSMLTLLRLTHGRTMVPGYVATLLAAFGEQPTEVLPGTIKMSETRS